MFLKSLMIKGEPQHVLLDSPFVSILAYQLSKLLILSLHSFRIPVSSSTVVALSMAILVWRKSGMPLKIGEAAR